MHDTPPPNVTPDPGARRSSVVPLASAGAPAPGTTDHVPTILGENPLARPVAVAFDLPAGSTLGHFELVAPLGAGGMASVFKAKDLTLGREVALKILPPALTADADAVTRFKFEARAAAKLNHDHVARVFFIGEDRGLHFIAFEFVDGNTLRDLIDARGPLAPADAVRHLLDVAVGLQHAAEKGVVHRDVKPSNIIVTPGGRAKLIDMGLARSVDPHSVNGQVTQSGMTLGTFDYISPEQAIDPRRADIRSDIYSLGCTFYHALTGQTPVPDGNAARKLAAHQTESPTDPRLINPTIPDALAAVLDRMMTKQPADRYQTAGELIADLNQLAVAMGLQRAASSSAEASPAAVPVARPRNLTAFVSLAVAVVATAVAAAVLAVANSGRPTGGPLPLPWSESALRPTTPTEPLGGDPVIPRPPSQVTVSTEAELVKALRENVSRVTLAAGTYDLTDESGVVLTNKVELESDGGAVLRLSAPPRGDRPADPRPGAITFHKCEVVKLKGLRVEFTPTDTPRGVGLLFHEAGTVEVSDCRFTLPPAGAMDGAMLAFTGRTGVAVRHGFFQSRGWTAVELPGGSKGEFTECGFVCGRAAIEVTPGTEPATATLTSTHTTFLLNNAAAAVSVLKGGRCDLAAGHTLFAAPASAEASGMMDRRAVILRAADATDTSTAAIPEGSPSAVFFVDVPPGVTAITVTESPWAAVPKSDPDNPFTPLELNTKLPQLRVGKTKADVLGVREWSERRKMYPVLPPLLRPGEAVWAPKLTDAEKAAALPNVFADLKEAVAYLKGKGTLLVRGSGPTPMPPLVLDAGTKAITVKPDADSAPVLVPAAGGDRRETLLFRLEAGELRLEGLQFIVKPGKSAEGAAVVSMSGGRKCELKQCVVTMDELGDQHTAVASLADVGKVVMKEFTDPPAVTLDQCLVRGRGRVVRAEAAVPATVTLTDVGVVTELAPAFDLGPPARSAAVSVQLSRVTAALSAPLLDVRANRKPDDKATAKVELHADNCLFLPLDKTAEPLLRATGLDPTSADRPLVWSTTGGNAFGGWVWFAEQLADDATEPKRWDAAEWRKWSGEPDSPVVALRKSPTTKSGARPSDLDTADPNTAGANLKALATLFPD
jgi:hypothetical protein